MKNSISDSTYYLEYGLERDPFPLDIIDKNIFLTPEINRRLKLAKQHIKTSEKLLLISSASGAGKSLLAEKLIILKEPDWRISSTGAYVEMTSETLAHSIIQQLLPDKNVNATQSISMLHKYLEQSYQDSTLPVIVIDDADKLSFTTLQFILQLADLHYNEVFFRFVFFANESITETIAKPGLKELAEGTIEMLSMPCFSQAQIAAYLKYRFTSCGDNIELPFTENEMEYLYKASGGLPGGINLLARQLMQEGLQKHAPRKSYGGMVLLLTLLLIVIVGYQYYENKVLKDAQVLLLKELQESPIEVMEIENLSSQGATDQSVIKQQDSSQKDLSVTYEPLFLKLSDMLIMQSTEKDKSSDTF